MREMGESMPLVDALAVWAEEGRVLERENIDESLSRRYQSMISEWGNPTLRKQDDLDASQEGNLVNWNI